MLPGEAQKIDRMMEAFASWYCENNSGKFSHEDTCYVLAFSTIMLNTALHNPSVKDKQSLDSFLNMNRGIDQGQDLQTSILTVPPLLLPRILRPHGLVLARRSAASAALGGLRPCV